ncbi:helix-turn-helix domain-containing protein [Streptomyces netropsis]|uniref:Transcriptional regulator with XRE-family HTH domain n=1 Tax=Streptomyces netropsis TaxID=55404 RepID=A0A7W7LJU3_STRNE|nr:helix-turn-helix transcriptional regulator [Streptomyces netropsis]MBB4890896.1 transcriptional regulator with XRE-family HTH domain [Streptomyces netropsis]
MGRREKPVDRTIPARAKLADFLRERKAAAGLTYEQMAKHSQVKEAPSQATLERAASGSTVPSWATVEVFVFMTITKDEELGGGPVAALHRSRELWIRARRATRAPYDIHAAPDPSLISSRADLSRALRRQHVWVGFPPPGEMERTVGSWALPRSTTRRIIAGDTLPVDPHQLVAFLKACYVIEPTDLEPWLYAAARAHTYEGLRIWKALQDLLAEAPEVDRTEGPPVSSDATVVYLQKRGAEVAA